VVLMTAKEEPHLKVQCEYDAFLPKPFDLYHLLGLVTRLIGTIA
jgi:hypothetical protein